MSSVVDYSQYVSKMRDYAAVLKKTWPSVLREEARLMAVSFAKSTQPYTKSDNWDESQRVGQAKVERDIRKVYATGGDVFEAIKKQDSEGMADAFYYLHQTNQIGGKKGAQVVMEASKTAFRGLRIEKLNPALHKAARGRGGRVPGRSPIYKQVVKNDGQLAKYIEKRQKLVGFAKAAWAACARLLGGVRGIPQWVTRQKSPASVQDNSKAESNPFVDFASTVRYADDALPAIEEAKALRIGQERFVKRMEITLEKAAESARLK